jgi:hypothetical protein
LCSIIRVLLFCFCFSSVRRLCDDLLLGEVITKLPWHTRPAALTVCRRRADSMTHSFPHYARLENPRILSKSLVLFHTPDQGYPAYDSLSLWVYSDNEGTLFNLPVPAIPDELRSDVKFVCDGNEERIYSFTPVNENSQNMYDVSVADLREGNVRWNKLPPLP